MQRKPTILIILAGFLLSLGILLGAYSILSLILFFNKGNYGMMQEFITKNVDFVIFFIHLPLSGFVLSITTIPGLGLQEFFYSVMPMSASGLSVAKSVAEPFMSMSIFTSSVISLAYGTSSLGLLKLKNWARKLALSVSMTIFGIELVSLLFWFLTRDIGGLSHIFVAASMIVPLSIMGLISGYLYKNRIIFHSKSIASDNISSSTKN